MGNTHSEQELVNLEFGGSPDGQPDGSPGEAAPSDQSIYRSTLDAFVASKKGSAFIYGLYVPLYIPIDAPILLICAKGHKLITLVENMHSWCRICDILQKLHLTCPGIICAEETYENEQESFEFKCPRNHRFISSISTAPRGCTICVMLTIMASKYSSMPGVDTRTVVKHQHTKIRFHCNKMRHNPCCENPKCMALRNKDTLKFGNSPECKNFVCCDQDFYATPYQVANMPEVMSCDNNHRWLKKMEVVTLSRMFEIQFDKRFDDCAGADGIEFTGYNKKLGIAFTHMAEFYKDFNKGPAHCVDIARSWCNKNNVKFIVIARENNKTPKVAVEMNIQLAALGLLDTSVNAAVKNMRTKMREMNRENKLYVDRCWYANTRKRTLNYSRVLNHSGPAVTSTRMQNWNTCLTPGAGL